MDHEHLRRLIFENARRDPHYPFRDLSQWDEVLRLLTADEAETVQFLKWDSCPETLFWLAPLLKELSRSFQSAGFIKFLRWYLEDLLEYPYCMENFLTPYMRDFVGERDFAQTVRQAIDEAEAVIRH